YRTTKLGGLAVLGNGRFVVYHTECRAKHPQTCRPARLFTRLKEMGNYHSVYMISRGMAPSSFPNSILHRLSFWRKPPNAAAQARQTAGATQERTLSAVACSRMLDARIRIYKNQNTMTKHAKAPLARTASPPRSPLTSTIPVRKAPTPAARRAPNNLTSFHV